MRQIEKTWDETKMGGGAIAQYPWGGDYRPTCDYRIGWTEHGLKVILRAWQSAPRRQITQENGDVWQDDCLELFLQVGTGYYNFEMNANGVMLACYGESRHDRIAIDRPEGLAVVPSITPESWSVALTVPWTLLTRMDASFRAVPGARLHLNLYKCGDATDSPHYAAAFPIPHSIAPAPDFHRPECFVLMTLS